MAASSDVKRFDSLAQLPHSPASDIKKLGWRSLMKVVRSAGKIVITNHNEPEAVILSAQEYADLVRSVQHGAAQTEGALEALRQRFDQRLSSLQVADAGDRLRSVMRDGARLAGGVKAGAGH